ncbi:MAG: VanZ family protein [Oculatellaceae cyanobacterium Prado106]|nr:VanZ family protein [Oculatellaceae cyanobacterium Prado106]
MNFRPSFSTWAWRSLLGNLLLILLCTLFPFNFEANSQLTLGWVVQSFLNFGDVRDFFVNILLFLGFGASLTSLGFQKTDRLLVLLGVAFLASAGLSASVEVLQIWIPNRDPALQDICSNGLGGVLGGLGVYGIRRGVGQEAIAQFISQIWRWLSWTRLTAIFCGYLALTLVISSAIPSSSSLETWDAQFPLIVGNEKTGDRPWQGQVADLYMANQVWPTAVIDQALSQLSWKNANAPGLLAAYQFQPASAPPSPTTQYPDKTQQLPALSWIGEVPPNTQPGNTPNGVVLGSRHWLMTANSVQPLSQSIGQTSQFSLMTAIAATQPEQFGPARIISISDGTSRRNLTLGQEDSDLVVRLRTFASGENGVHSDIKIPEFFTDLRQHRLVITYLNSNLSIYVDQLSNLYSFNLSTELIRQSREILIFYYGMLFIPLGMLLGAMLWNRRHLGKLKGWKGVAIALALLLPPLLLELLLTYKGNRSLQTNNLWLSWLFMTMPILLFQVKQPGVGSGE